MQSQLSGSRLEPIDFLRGLAIVEMLAAHYAAYFPGRVGKLVSYTETAMALFVLLAGFVVGWGYKKFQREPGAESRTVLKRALRVLAIQYLIILTVCVPLHLLGMPEFGTNQPMPAFLFQSMAFLNQIGLIHILPTFIPLFAISPAILFALSRDWDVPLLLVSLGLFCVGHFHPYLLDLGQPTIFPFLLFQLYFVVGCLLGKRTRCTGSLPPRQPRRWLMVSCLLLLTTMYLAHGKVVPAHLISTHPLNLFGLMYHAPIISTLWLLSVVLWPKIQRLWVFPYVTRFGRHALLAFVMHVYLAKALGVLNYFESPPSWVNYLLILASVLFMNAILHRYELSKATERPPAWSRAVQGLFK